MSIFDDENQSLEDLIKSLNEANDEDDNIDYQDDEDENLELGSDEDSDPDSDGDDSDDDDDGDDDDGNDGVSDEIKNGEQDENKDENAEDLKESAKEKADKAKEKGKEKIDELKDKAKEERNKKKQQEKDQKEKNPDKVKVENEKADKPLADQERAARDARLNTKRENELANNASGKSLADETNMNKDGAAAKSKGSSMDEVANAGKKGTEEVAKTGTEEAAKMGAEASSELGAESAAGATTGSAAATGTGSAAATGTGTAAATGTGEVVAEGVVGAAAWEVLVAILIVALVIIAIIFIICAIVFFTSMPGMLIGKLKDILSSWSVDIRSFFGSGDNVSNAVNEEDVRGLAQYLQDMGYDIQSYGLGDVIYDTLEETTTEYDANGNATEVKEEGQAKTTTVRGADNINMDDYDQEGVNKLQATREIKAMVADDSASILNSKDENGNAIIGSVAIDLGARTTLESYMIAGCSTYAKTHENLAGFFRKGDSKNYSEGLLNFKSHDQYATIEGDSLIMSDHTIGLTTNHLRLHWGDTFKFDLSDWTGLYGKPIELMLAVHFSTMMPDLAEEISSKDNFNTKVNIEVEEKNVYFEGITLTCGESEFSSGDIAREALKECIENQYDTDHIEEFFAYIANNQNISDKNVSDLTAKLLTIVYTPAVSETGSNDAEIDDSSDWDFGSNVKSALDTYCTEIAGETEYQNWYSQIEHDGNTDESGFNNYHIAEEDNGSLGAAWKNQPCTGKFAGILTQGQLCQLARMNKNEDDSNMQMLFPYITDVTDHWYYKKIDFMSKYKRAKKATKKMDVSIEEDSASYDLLVPSKLRSDIKIVADAVITGGVVYQEEDPDLEGPNNTIISIFKDNKYYKYDGSMETAQKIAICNAIDEGRDKYYFNGSVYQVDSEDKADAPTWKDEGLYGDVSFGSSRDTMSAFSILENVDTDEADICLRCLKELVVYLEYFSKEDLMSTYTKVLKWCFKQKGIKGDQWIINREGLDYGIEVRGLNKEDDKGEYQECKVVAPGYGEIMKIEEATGLTSEWDVASAQYKQNQTTGMEITIKFGVIPKDETEKENEKLADDYYKIETNSAGEGITVLNNTMKIKYLDKTYYKKEDTPLTKGQKVEPGDVLGIIKDHSAIVTMQYADGTDIGSETPEKDRDLLTANVDGKKKKKELKTDDHLEDFMSPLSGVNWFDNVDYSEDEIMTIYAIIAAEAGPGDELGVKGVCSCVVNRVNQGCWGGDTIYDVLTAKNQFEAYSEGDTSHGWYKYYTGEAELSDDFKEWVDEIFESGQALHGYHSFKAFPNQDKNKYSYRFDNDTYPTKISTSGNGNWTEGKLFTDDPKTGGNFFHN